MKTIDTSNISGSVKAPFLKKTFEHYNEAIKEGDAETLKGLISGYSASTVYILHGCVISGSDPGSRTMTAGAVFYNGEIYLVDAASFTTTGSQIPVWVINNDGGTQVAFSDGNNYDLHKTSKFVLQAGLSGSGIADYNATTNFSDVTVLESRLDTLQFNIDLKANKALPSFILASGLSAGYNAGSLSYRKNDTGLVEFVGSFEVVSPGGVTVLTLPAGYRPSSDFIRQVVHSSSGTPTTRYLRITTTGIMDFLDGTPPAGFVYLSGVAYHAA